MDQDHRQRPMLIHTLLTLLTQNIRHGDTLPVIIHPTRLIPDTLFHLTIMEERLHQGKHLGLLTVPPYLLLRLYRQDMGLPMELLPNQLTEAHCMLRNLTALHRYITPIHMHLPRYQPLHLPHHHLLMPPSLHHQRVHQLLLYRRRLLGLVHPGTKVPSLGHHLKTPVGARRHRVHHLLQ